MRGDPAGIFLAPSPVCCGARQFGSDRRRTGLLTDIADLALMTQSGRARAYIGVFLMLATDGGVADISEAYATINIGGMFFKLMS